MINLRNRTEDIREYMGSNDRINVIWGIGLAEYAIKEFSIIDFFVDKKADKVNSIHGVDVILPSKLEELYRNNSLPMTIIILTMPKYPKVTVHQIYDEIYSLDIVADVFDYWGNVGFFSNKLFSYRGTEYELFEHPYNCFLHDTRMSERGVELALIKAWMKKTDGPITEVGAVSPYYFTDMRIEDIIDPADKHRRVTNRSSIFDIDLKDKSVICVSTLEHIGTGEYGLVKSGSPTDALNKILEESQHCLVTFPYGYNDELDKWLNNHYMDDYVTVMARGLNNSWREVDFDKESIFEYRPAPLYAFGLIIIEK